MFRKHMYFFIIFVGLLSCRKENTSWSTKWSFPIIKDQLNLQHLFGDTLLKNDSSGCSIVYEKSLYNLNLSEYIKIPDTTISSELSINFPSLNLNPGTILSQKNVENEISIGDAQLKRIVVRKGSIEIVLKNPLTTKTIYTIEIPSFTKNGVSVKQTLIAQKGTTSSPSTISSTLDLSGYSIDLSGLDNNTFNTILTNFDMQLDPDGSVTKVSNKDITMMDIKISDIKIEYAQGYFGNLHINSNYEVPFDGIKKITNGTLNFNQATVELTINNSCKIMARGKINSLTSFRTSTTTLIPFQNIQLNNPFFIAPAQTTGNTITSSQKKFILNEKNSNLLPFLENFGDRYKIDYSFELNPYGNLNGGWDEIFPTSGIELKIKSVIPLKFNAQQLTFQDTLSIDLNTINKKLESGSLKLHCETNIPINSKVYLYFLNSNRKIIETLIGSNEILGKPTSSKENQISIVYFSPKSTFYNNSNLIKYVVIKTILNSVDSNYEFPYNGTLNFQLSGDFQTNTSY